MVRSSGLVVLAERLCLAIASDEGDGVGLAQSLGVFHAGGAHGHARQDQALGIGAFLQQSLDVIGWHMAFDEITGNLSGMSGSHAIGNTQP